MIWIERIFLGLTVGFLVFILLGIFGAWD